MKSKAGKDLTYILRTTAVISSMAVPLFFTGCVKPTDPPKAKSMEQSVAIKEDVKIEYSATLSNVDKAKLNIKREGVLISTEEISDVTSAGPDYKKTYSYDVNPLIKKGNYELILESENSSDNLGKKSNYVTIPDYPTSVTYSTGLNLNENSEITVPLTFEDKNLDDNPIHAVSATSSQVQATLNGDNLSIKAPLNYYGPYQLKLKFGGPGGLEEKTLQGNVIEDKRIDYTHRPNAVENLGLNYYGSGDADGNNQLPLNQNDLDRLIQVANGTYTNTSDTRLRDRCDINGDGYVNLADVETLRDKLNGTILYIQGDWDNLPTRAEKEDWAKKMIAIDKTNEIHFPGGGDCNQWTDQTFINFYGVSATDIPKFEEVYPYDFKDNGRFNLPLEEVIIQKYDADGAPLGAHAMNAFMFGNPSIFKNINYIAPETDQMNIPIEEDPVVSINSEVYMRGPPILGVFEFPNGKKVVEQKDYVRYEIKNKIPALTYTNPDLIIPSGK